MDLENYPAYVNVVPELPTESYTQISQQITTSEPLSYDFDVSNVNNQIPNLNTKTVLPTIAQKTNTKSIGKLSCKKKIPKSLMKNNTNVEQHGNTFTETYINGLSSLLKDEAIHTTDNKLIKYDSTTGTNVIFHLVKPSDLEENHIEKKLTKRGRTRKYVTKSTKTKQDTSSQQFKPENIIEYPLMSTKSGRLSKPPKYLLNEFPIIDNNDNIDRKLVEYNIKSDFLCKGCGKTYLGHKRMQEHLKRFPSHTMNITEQQIDSELQDTFKTLHETPLLNGKKKPHTRTKVLKDQHCGYIKSKKNLAFHLKQVMKQVNKSDIVKSLVGTISIWDLLSSILESGNLQEFSKELNTIITNLQNMSKSLKLVSKCELNSIDNQMFINDSLGHLFGLPNGSYSLQNTENEYEIKQPDDLTISSVKPVQPKVSTTQNSNCHSSPINLNLFDSQLPKVDFLPRSSIKESIMCVENQEALESVDGLVSERIHTMSDFSEYYGHSSVPIIDYPILSTSSASNVSLSQPDTFMDHGVYDIFSNDLNLVPTSTEEFIKSLEQFEPLNVTDNSPSSETRILDFEDLHHTFYTN